MCELRLRSVELRITALVQEGSTVTAKRRDAMKNKVQEDMKVLFSTKELRECRDEAGRAVVALSRRFGEWEKAN